MNLNKNGMKKRWRCARGTRGGEEVTGETGRERKRKRESEGMRKMPYILGVVEPGRRLWRAEFLAEWLA